MPSAIVSRALISDVLPETDRQQSSSLSSFFFSFFFFSRRKQIADSVAVAIRAENAGRVRDTPRHPQLRRKKRKNKRKGNKISARDTFLLFINRKRFSRGFFGTGSFWWASWATRSWPAKQYIIASLAVWTLSLSKRANKRGGTEPTVEPGEADESRAEFATGCRPRQSESCRQLISPGRGGEKNCNHQIMPAIHSSFSYLSACVERRRKKKWEPPKSMGSIDGRTIWCARLARRNANRPISRPARPLLGIKDWAVVGGSHATVGQMMMMTCLMESI